MIYRVRLNRKIHNIKVYTVLKKSGQKQNVITKLFMGVFAKKGRSDEAKG